MRGSPLTNVIRRLDTGEKCEYQGCRETALWVVSYKSQSSHWCVKHTRVFMRELSYQEGKARTRAAARVTARAGL
jgi:hypothetical protein